MLKCSIMRKSSVRELHIDTSELVREAADGGIIAGKKARIFTSMRNIWARMPQVGDSTKILEEDRTR